MIQSHREKGLQMSSANSTANYMQAMKLKNSFKIPAINKLKKGKASDNNGIRPQDIRTCDNETNEMIKLIFNEVLKQESSAPEIWRRIQIKVIRKERERRRRRKLSPDLYFVSAAHTVFDCPVQQTLSQA